MTASKYVGRTAIAVAAVAGLYGAPAAAQGDAGLAHEDERPFMHVLADQLEVQNGNTGNSKAWDAQAWMGGDYNKLWVKTEGRTKDGQGRDADAELLYDRASTAFWDLQVGMRHDFRPGPTRNWVAFGVQGLAPYWFNIEATAYVGNSGRTAARFKAFYELLFTQRLILEPQIEANIYGQDDAERGIGSGLSDTRVGLRLRYEVTREFAPYIGVERRQAYGRTADFVQSGGESSADTLWVAGLRAWY